MGMLSAVQRVWKDGLLRTRRNPPPSRPNAPEVSSAAPSEPEPRAGVGPPADHSGADVAGWLRIVEENDGAAVHAALFLTSGRGEPVGFCFTRGERYQSTSWPPRAGEPADLSSLVGSLLRAAVPAPVLVLGLASEAASGFPEGVVSGLPWGCVAAAAGEGDLGGAGGTSGAAVEWSRAPDNGSAARRLFGEICRQTAPFEPLERAGLALEVAFADVRVEGLTAVGGLTTVIALSAPASRQGRPTGAGERPSPGANLAERLWAALAPPPRRAGLEKTIELDWPRPLMPFQQEGVLALLARDRLLLADDMGLGKTVQAIAAVRILQARNTTAACLVAAPASLLDQWRREIAKWAPELSAIIVRGSAADREWQWAARVDVTLVSYDTLRADAGRAPRATVGKRRWDVVVADEAQRLKNRNDTSDVLKRLRRARSWALTGTPIENHEEELASILEFVDHVDGGAPKRYRPGDALRARHRELQLRRRKGEVLDELPDKQITKVPIELSPRQRGSYERAERDGIIYLKSLGAEVRLEHVLELITRLKQICNADPQTGESSKLADIRDRLAQLTAQGHRALVFSQYTSDTSGVGAAVRRLEAFRPLAFTGGMSREERTAVVDRFRADDMHKVLVLSLRAGGLGLNLPEASYVFHLDRWWNPAIERQAEDRSHRIGQTVKVHVVKYSCIGTIEERIDAVLERKQALFEELVDDVSLDLTARMNRRELLGLFGLG